MAAQDNQAISRRFFAEVCSAGDLEVIDELVTADAVHLDRDAEEYHGPAAAAQPLQQNDPTTEGAT